MENQTQALVSLINAKLADQASQLKTALADVISRLGATPTIDGAEIEALLPAAEPVPAAVSGGGDLSSIRRWVATIDDERNQVNILKFLLQAAGEHATRACLFIARGDGFTGWAATGLTGSGSVSDDQVKNVNIPSSAETILRAAATGGPTHGEPGAHSQNRALLEALGGVTPRQMAAFPLVNKGRVAAVLYADSGSPPAGLANVDALEIIARAATMSVELIGVRSKEVPVAGARPAATAPQPAATAPQPAAAQPAAPQPAAAQPAAPQPAAPQPAAPQPAAPQPAAPQPAAPQPAAPQAAAPRLAAPQPAAPQPAAPRPAAPQPEAPAARDTPTAAPDLSSLPPDEEKLHKAAQRFARLLVSEIKLYNEVKVVEGRTHRDLYKRLKEDIDRSQQMYGQRVNPQIAATTNYFFDELVKTLADGDRSLLEEMLKP